MMKMRMSGSSSTTKTRAIDIVIPCTFSKEGPIPRCAAGFFVLAQVVKPVPPLTVNAG
jgi:hypothetical protein